MTMFSGMAKTKNRTINRGTKIKLSAIDIVLIYVSKITNDDKTGNAATKIIVLRQKNDHVSTNHCIRDNELESNTELFESLVVKINLNSLSGRLKNQFNVIPYPNTPISM